MPLIRRRPEGEDPGPSDRPDARGRDGRREAEDPDPAGPPGQNRSEVAGHPGRPGSEDFRQPAGRPPHRLGPGLLPALRRPDRPVLRRRPAARTGPETDPRGGGAEARARDVRPADPRTPHPSASPRPRLTSTTTVRRLAGRPNHNGAPDTSDHAPRSLRVAAGYSWRLLVLAGGVWLVGTVTNRLLVPIVALFAALVITAVLRPVANLLARVLPRPLATLLSFLVALVVIGGLITFVAVSVSNQVDKLSDQFVAGVEAILSWVQSLPLPIGDNLNLDQIGPSIQKWLVENQGALVNAVVSRAGIVVEFFAGLALAVFSAIFFINSGTKMWGWFLAQVPERAAGRWAVAGRAAWDTFSGYTRGIFIVAGTNGIFAGIGLAILGVPLSAPLAVLVFVGTFIPLIGAPAAMIVATVVALAAKGPLVAGIVLVMIVLIGQFEGHVLQPLVMGSQVDLHPVVVAVSVVCGTIVGGVIGAIVAVPVVSVAWSVFDTLRHLQPEDLPAVE